MTEVKYYPLIDCDSEGTEKMPMFPVTESKSIMAQSELWLEELVLTLQALCQNQTPGHGIQRPRPPLAKRCVHHRDINETKLGHCMQFLHQRLRRKTLWLTRFPRNSCRSIPQARFHHSLPTGRHCRYLHQAVPHIMHGGYSKFTFKNYDELMEFYASAI
jgi:hypothetical protein